MTEAEYWGRVRSALRKAFAYWKPAQEALKLAECGTRIHPTTGKPRKVYRCAACGRSDYRDDMQMDHVEPCGALRSLDDLAVFLDKLTCEDPSKFQVLHKACHRVKTNAMLANRKTAGTEPALGDRAAIGGFTKRAADRLAYAVAKCIERGVIGTRSGPADALLDYLEIGQSGGSNSVPEWVEDYEAKQER